MRIVDGYGRTADGVATKRSQAAAAQKTQGTASPKRGSPVDGNVLVRLGTVAEATNVAARKGNLPDQSRVAEVLRKIEDGDFQLDFERLADKMIGEELPRGSRKQ